MGLRRPPVGMDRRTRYRLNVYHLATDLPEAVFLKNHPGNQAIKKPGLNKSSTGITSVPGLFSELFNVAASRPAQMTTEPVKYYSPGCLSSRHAPGERQLQAPAVR